MLLSEESMQGMTTGLIQPAVKAAVLHEVDGNHEDC